MTREEAEQYLYYAMTIGEQLLCCGAEVGRVEDTIRRICLAYGATRADVFFYHIQYCDDYLWRGFWNMHPDAACAGNVQ